MAGEQILANAAPIPRVESWPQSMLCPSFFSQVYSSLANIDECRGGLGEEGTELARPETIGSAAIFWFQSYWTITILN